MTTKKTLSILAIMLFCISANAQEITKGSVAYYEAMRISFQTKIDWVQSNPEENALATESNWYEMANSNVQQMITYKSLAEQSPSGIYLPQENKSLNTETGGELCELAAPLCLNIENNYPCGTAGNTAETGPDYGCLGSQPNPAWYYMQVDGSGDLVMSAAAPQDIDFIIWGPFTDKTCDYNDLSAENIVDCSYSSTNQETPEIGPGSSGGPTTASTGEWYMLLITNFSQATQDFTLSQTNLGELGAGSINCNLAQCPLIPINLLTDIGECYPLQTDTVIQSMYDISGQINFQNSSMVDSVVLYFDDVAFETIYEPTSDSILFSLEQIISDNLEHTLSIIFHNSDTTECYSNYYYTNHVDCNACQVYAGDDVTGCSDLLTNPYIHWADYNSFWSSTDPAVIFNDISDPHTLINYAEEITDTIVCQLVWTITNQEGLTCSDTSHASFLPPANLNNLNVSNEFVCENNEMNATVNYQNDFIYNWTLPEGWTGDISSNTVDITNNGQSGTVQVFAQNACGNSDTLSKFINVISSVPSQPSVIQGNNPVCSNSLIAYSVVNIPGTTYFWNLPSGWSGNSYSSEITVNTGSNGGTITLVPFNDCGMGISRTLLVEIQDLPIADFSYTLDQSELSFINLSENSNSYYWDFGDGESSIEPNPVHEYTQNGSYTIIMFTGNECGSDSIYTTIAINTIAIGENQADHIEIYPNPSKGLVNISGLDYTGGEIMVVDLTGRILIHKHINNADSRLLDLANFNNGMYQVIIKQKDTIIKKSIVVQK